MSRKYKWTRKNRNILGAAAFFYLFNDSPHSINKRELDLKRVDSLYVASSILHFRNAVSIYSKIEAISH